MTEYKNIIVYTDGSSIGNPGPGGWGAIVVFPDGGVSELGGAEAHTTNNRMELTGPIRALEEIEKLKSEGKIILHTDSQYVINGITKWIHNWKKKDWVTSLKQEVMNRELWEELHEIEQRHEIEWRYVRGHQDNDGNNRVDEIANTLARGGEVELYQGPLSGYSVPLGGVSKVSPEGDSPKKKGWYVSLIGGKVAHYNTWAACEESVKGKSGAKFKKVQSEHEEEGILKKWRSESDSS